MQITNSSSDHHVAVLAFPFSTHAGLLLGLVRRLAAAVPNTTFSFYSTAKSNESLFSVPKPENIKPYSVWDGVPEGYVFSGNIEDHVNLFLEAAEEGFKGAMRMAEAETGRRIRCVMADAFLWFSGSVAEEMGALWLPLWTSGACSLSVHCYTDLIRETVGIHGIAGREDELLKFIPGFSELRLGDLPGGVLFGNLKSPFSIMLHKMGQALPKAAAVLINSLEELDPEINKDLNSKFQKVLNVGPFNLTSPPSSSNVDEYGCIPWLDEHKPASVAYIGFGTVAKPTPIEVVALAEALEASSTPFLWSIKEDSKVNLPEGFLNRTRDLGKIVPWAPQVQVLAHRSTGVFITHCGWNSVLESIVAGIPMIGRPFFGDHNINTWMVENVWKIGVRVEGGVFTKSETMRALELVLSHEKGKQLKEQIGHFSELALKAVGPKGSSSQNFNTLLDAVTGHNP
ncbi:anthocyanidin 3-O-galactosyltransferase F3GT1-like [Actinidia eriantha]|uniref:anthocyanidin 3-O-galactosyltransferase F3GT1-like n=1 Tax=Actinidia eriantha TaxID=165200 RepID=UPI002586A0F4|nr:anthocyanidin 3-O-galactosyltransferase F3GT1-like [Actinidia eriantha]